MTTCVFLSHSAADSGAEQSVVAGLSAWPDGSSRPVLVLAEDGPIVERARRVGVDTLVVPMPGAARGLRRGERRPGRILRTVFSLVAFSSRMRAVLADRQADVVVAQSVKSLVYGLIAGRRTGARVVWSIHDRLAPDYFPRVVVPVLRHVLPRLVDGLIVNSESTLATVRPGRTPVLVASPPVRLDEREFSPPADPLRSVVVVGRLAPWKAQDNFLRAFARAFRGSGVRAEVVGGPLFGESEYERSLVDLAESLGIADQVDFTGHVTDVWDHLADADILVHCSRIPEPFGQVVVEGLWARCAVVAATPGGPAEVITDRVDGLLTPCDDVDALARALAELRDDPALRRRLADRGRLTAYHYDASRTVPVVCRWLTSLAGGGLGPGSIQRRGAGSR